LGDTAVVIGSLFSSLVEPLEFLFVSDNTSGEGGAVVSTPTNEHDSEFGNFGVSFESVFLFQGGDN
jgi:hypothetical protein